MYRDGQLKGSQDAPPAGLYRFRWVVVFILSIIFSKMLGECNHRNLLAECICDLAYNDIEVFASSHRIRQRDRQHTCITADAAPRNGDIGDALCVASDRVLVDL